MGRPASRHRCSDHATGGMIESGQNECQRRFAHAGFREDTDFFTRHDFQVEMLEDPRSVRRVIHDILAGKSHAMQRGIGKRRGERNGYILFREHEELRQFFKRRDDIDGGIHAARHSVEVEQQGSHNHFGGDELPEGDVADRQQPTAQSDHAAVRERLKDDGTLVLRAGQNVGARFTRHDVGLNERIGFFKQERKAVGGFEMEPVNADVLQPVKGLDSVSGRHVA